MIFQYIIIYNRLYYSNVSPSENGSQYNGEKTMGPGSKGATAGVMNPAIDFSAAGVNGTVRSGHIRAAGGIGGASDRDFNGMPCVKIIKHGGKVHSFSDSGTYGIKKVRGVQNDSKEKNKARFIWKTLRVYNGCNSPYDSSGLTGRSWGTHR